MKEKTPRKRSFLLKFLILAFCIYMVVTLSNLWSTYNESMAELNSLNIQKQAEESAIEELKAMLKDESNKQIIEKAARERLGYIYSDEQIFIDISGN